jgi:FlgD Ig-like domain
MYHCRGRSLGLLGIICLLACPSSAGANVHDYAVEVSARIRESPPQIDFSWVADGTAEEYWIFKKAPEDTCWTGPVAHLPGGSISWSDSDVQIGQAYEYGFRKVLGNVTETVSTMTGIDVVFTIRDAWNDGICCHHGLGSYRISGCGFTYGEGGDFGAVDSLVFTTGESGTPCYEVDVEITLDVWANETTWKLTDIDTGEIYSQGGPYECPRFGHILSGIKVPEVDHRGTVLLLVDSTHMTAIAPELQRLHLDLIGDGYQVEQIAIEPAAEVTVIKQQIVDACALNPDITTLFLLGNIPVPYSGFERGVHTDHVGAWPADLYYGEFDGPWTDSEVYTVSAFRPENHNVPGDGKFDQTFIPSPVDLEIGRVDLSDMPAFSESELELLRRYLLKDHNFRTGRATAQHRGLIDDNVGDAMGLAFAACGWRNFSTMFGAENVSNGDFFPDLVTDSYLWSYGCGGSGYTHCGGVGGTSDFAQYPVQSVFTVLYGSYFGDWDNTDNVLRAPLGAAGLPLCCFYAGRPTWNFHQMALGVTLGYITRKNQNNHLLYTIADGGSQIHVALMGDPTLKMHIVQPVANLGLQPGAPGEVTLQWSGVEGAAGYNIYSAQNLGAEFTRRNLTPVADTTYSCNVPADENVFMVRTRKLEHTASGSFYNLSCGVIDSLDSADVHHDHEPEFGMFLSGHPNPFNDETLIRYSLPGESSCQIRIFDVNGGLIRTLLDGTAAGGEHSLYWDGRDRRGVPAPTGCYLLEARFDGKRLQKRITLVR